LLGNLVTAATSDTTIPADAPAQPSGATAEFLDYMKKTPAQRWQDAWLKSHGITQEQFDAMSPAEKWKILQQIREDMEAKMKDQMEHGGKGTTDILA
jgi:hypothetical protein